MTTPPPPAFPRRTLDPDRSRQVRTARRQLVGAGCLVGFSWLSLGGIPIDSAADALRLVVALVEHAAAAVLLAAAVGTLVRAGRGCGRRRAPRLALLLVAAGLAVAVAVLAASGPPDSAGGGAPAPRAGDVVLALLVGLPPITGGLLVLARAWPPLAATEPPRATTPGRLRRLRLVAAAGAVATIAGVIDRLRMGGILATPQPDFRAPVGLWEALHLPGAVPLAAWALVLLAACARLARRSAVTGRTADWAGTTRGAVGLGAALVFLAAATQYLTVVGPFAIFVVLPIPLPDLQLDVSPLYGGLAHLALLAAALGTLVVRRGRPDGGRGATPSAAAAEARGRHGAPGAPARTEPRSARVDRIRRADEGFEEHDELRDAA